jgi:signal transduction histidine kinase
MKYSVIRTDTDSQPQGSRVALALRKDIVAALTIVLALARILFSLVILNTIETWDDRQWTLSQGLALLPLSWGALANMLAYADQFRWKNGGRIMALGDMAVSAAVIIFFPDEILPALALIILSGTFLAFRHDGNFGLLCSALPFTALLASPLGLVDILGIARLVSDGTTGVAGEMVAFILSLLATIFAILVILHIRRIEAPLTYQQPWERDFSVKLGAHNIEQVAYYIDRIYSGSKIVCILDIPGPPQGRQIITSSSILQSNIEQQRSELTDYANHRSFNGTPIIMDFEKNMQIAVESGRRSPIPVSLKKIVPVLTGLGFNDAVLINFSLNDISGRLLFSTDSGLIGEAYRTDMIKVSDQLDQFFASATKWDKRRKEMIALARDLARRDLHDGILQSLAALKMRLITIISAPNFTSHPEIESLRKTIGIIAIEQLRLRALLHNDEVDDDTVNLVEAIEICIKMLSVQWDISVTLESQEPALPVDRQSAENIEYLVREAIANAARHDGVRELTLTMALNNRNLMITLNDDLGATSENGRGKQNKVAMLKSRSLMQRLTMVKGNVLSAGLKVGTLLAVNIPLDFTEND